MACTRASLKAINEYLKDLALQKFEIISFEYEPSLVFGRQLREDIAQSAKDMARKHKNSKWLAIAYARSPLTFQLKRIISAMRFQQGNDETEGIPVTEWKSRICHCEFRYTVYSPDPSYIEDLEELLVVNDLGETVATTCYLRFNETKQVIPYTFNLNVERFNVESFDHLDYGDEGVFSILTMRAAVNFPVMTLHKVFGDSSGKLAKTIELTAYLGDTPNVEIFKSTIG